MCCFCQHPIEAARFCAGYLSEKRSQNLLAVEIFILNNAWQFQLNIKQDETSLRHVRVKLGARLEENISCYKNFFKFGLAYKKMLAR